MAFTRNIIPGMQLLNDITHKIQQNMDHGKFTYGIFINLKKAFNTVNHGIFLIKLHHLGIWGVIYMHDWLKSYLSNHQHTVMKLLLMKLLYLESWTHVHTVWNSTGPSPGTSYFPNLYLIWLMIYKILITFSLFIANDTSILYDHKNLHWLETIVNKELNKLCEWLRTNRLFLNVKKN